MAAFPHLPPDPLTEQDERGSLFQPVKNPKPELVGNGRSVPGGDEMPGIPRWRRRHTLVNWDHQIPFTTVLLAQMTVVILTIAGFAFMESRETMAIVLGHIADFPLSSHAIHVSNQTFLFQVMLVIGLAAMVQIMFGIYSSHKIAGPVVKMSAMLNRAANGDFSARALFRRDDHLEGVASALNRMLGALGATQATRRAELAAIDALLIDIEGSPDPDPEAIGELRQRIARFSGVEVADPVGAGR